MDFLITNMTGFRNKGCESSTKAIINEITKLQSNAQFKILTEDLNYNALWIFKIQNRGLLGLYGLKHILAIQNWLSGSGLKKSKIRR
ncbi:MAG: hypothetical protein IBV52_00015 [Candidatus Bathyarchaeota archaeon]